MSLALIREGRELADEALAQVLPFARVVKAGGDHPDPLTPSGFDKVVLALIGKLRRAVAGPEKKALETTLSIFDGASWSTMSAANRSKLIAYAATKYLGLAEAAAPAVGQILLGAGKTIALDTKRAANEHHDLRVDAHLSAIDQAVLDAAASHTALYVRDQYGRRRQAISAQARAVVAEGLERGYDRHEIGKMLRAQVVEADFKRSDAYFRMVADVFASRARNYASLSSYADAGVDAYEIVAVMDEATTEVCRFLDGKVFSTRAALDRYAQVAASADPEVVRDLQPWARVVTEADGARAITFGDKVKHVAAYIDAPGIGSREKGSYDGTSDDLLQSRGLTSPPFHAHCRTTTVPTERAAPAVQVPAKVPAPPPPGAVPNATAPAEAPVPLVADIGDLVRPLPAPLGVNAEVLPRYVPPPPAAPPISPEAQAIKDALAKLAALPQAHGSAGPFPGSVVHGLPHNGVDSSGFALPPPYDGTLVTNAKLVGAKKQKGKLVLLDEVTMPSPNVKASLVKAEVEVPGSALPIFVKHGGKIYAHPSAMPSVVAQQLLGKTAVQGAIVDLDKAPKVKKPKGAIVLPPPAAKAPDASVILHRLDGAAKGSNEGGFYTGSDGVKRYVKFYKDPAQAHCEHLANSIYESLGLGAPKSVIFEHEGRVAYASEIVSGKTLAAAGLSKKHADAVMRGFAADILTGNWDAVGTGLDNAFVLDTGELLRIDNGGTFLMRAQAGRKPAHLLDKITEWEGFFQSNPYYKQVASAHGASRAEEVTGLTDQIQKVLDLRAAAGGWDAYLARTVPGMSGTDRDAVVAMLDARSKLLEEKLKTLTAAKPSKPVDRPWPGKYVEPQKSNVLPRPGLTIDELPEVGLPAFYGKHEGGKLPSGELESDYERRANDAISKASPAARDAIVAFTGSDYRRLRQAEAHTDDELRATGWDMSRISTYRAKAKAVREAYDVVPHEPGTVFRGIQNLKLDVHRLYLEGGEFALGADNKPGTASSTWRADVSVDTFMGGPEDHADDKACKILFIFRQKTGIPIQTISNVEYEKEILLRSDARFRITGLGRLRGTKRVLVVEAEEVDP